MLAKTIIKKYAYLMPEETVRDYCPLCKVKTFTVTRNSSGSLVWNCFRASCDLKGSSSSAPMYISPDEDDVETKPVVPKTNPYKGELRLLSRNEQAFLCSKIGFNKQHIFESGVSWAIDLERYAFPILDPMRMLRGWSMRSWEKEPKALIMKDKEEPMLSYYPCTGFSPSAAGGGKKEALIVEDIPSAVRASLYYDAVAINSSGVGMEPVLEIRSWRPNVIWSLDNDAIENALKMHKRHKIHFETSRVIYLPKDLKDFEEQDLKEFLDAI